MAALFAGVESLVRWPRLRFANDRGSEEGVLALGTVFCSWIPDNGRQTLAVSRTAVYEE